MQALKEFMGRLSKSQKKQRHTHLLKLLNLLIRALSPGADAVSVLLENLNNSGSLGIAMAQLAAMTPPYVPQLTKYMHIPIPCTHIQCDVRGSITVSAKRDHRFDTEWEWD